MYKVSLRSQGIISNIGQSCITNDRGGVVVGTPTVLPDLQQSEWSA